VASLARPIDDASNERVVTLKGGTLTLRVLEAAWDLDRLCDFAARDNAKRGFLIVSRVLGRHLPVEPAEMRASFAALAARLPADLPGPVLVVGMAETAVALGQGVHAEYVRRTGRSDTLYLHSTRQQIYAPVLARFEEPHSHAPAHILYRPADRRLAMLAENARSLVVVDDEASTGTTFVNLAQALVARLPSLEQVLTAVLTDWSGTSTYIERMPVSAQAVSLLRGTFWWEADPALQPTQIPAATAASLGTFDQRLNFGRLGIDRDPSGIEVLADRFTSETGFYVLGTGEFTYPPFLLAEALERKGHEVFVQATTRSPVHIGGAMACARRLADNYGTPVPNFLYNSSLARGRKTLVCHETPAGSVDPELVAALNATAIDFGSLS
jgi:hypothetical protein